jgi:hypothetical protein
MLIRHSGAWGGIASGEEVTGRRGRPKPTPWLLRMLGRGIVWIAILSGVAMTLFWTGLTSLR